MDLSEYLKGYIRITLTSIKTPEAFFRGIEDEGKQYLKPLVYALISFIVYMTGSSLGFLSLPETSPLFSSENLLLALLLLYVVLAVPSILFYATLQHISVLLVGGKGKFNDTLKVICYSYAPMNFAWLFGLPMVLAIALESMIGILIALVFMVPLFASILYMFYIVVVGIAVTSGISRSRAFASIIIQLIIYTIAITTILVGIIFLVGFSTDFQSDYPVRPYGAIDPTGETGRVYHTTTYLGSTPLLDGNVDERDAWYEGEDFYLEAGGKNYIITTKHDRESLFVLMQWDDTNEWKSDMHVYFEQDEDSPDYNINNGRVDSYYQGHPKYGPESLRDAHGPSFTVQEEQNGFIKAGYRNGTWVLEWQVPLRSGDVYDIYIGKYPVKLGFSIVDWGEGVARGVFPPAASPYRPDTWGTLTIVDNKRQ